MSTPYRSRRTLKPTAMDPARQIPRELLLSLLEDAHWAPTHGLTQPWRFHVFASAESREALGHAIGSLYDMLTPADQRQPEKRAKHSASPASAPVVIALIARIDPNGKIAEWEELAALSCAAQNLMLSAHEQGIGSFWSSFAPVCSPEFVSWLGMDETHRSFGLLYLGHPLHPERPPHSVRAPLEERVVWH